MTPAAQLRGFASAVYGGCSGFVEVAYFTRGRMRASHIPVEEFTSDPTPLLELAQGGVDVYLGCVTLSEKPAKGRGKSAQRADVPGAWLDLDIAVAGHHKPREDGLRHLDSVEEAELLVGKAGLPVPTALLHSGGGLYAWWLFEEALSLQGDGPDRLGGLSLVEALNQHVADTAAELGIGVDKVGDASRILRPPGTLNWKRGALDPQPVRLLHLEEDSRISSTDLAALLEDVNLSRRFTATIVSERSTGADKSGPSLADAARAASWEEILFPLGWTYGAPVSGATSFLRPGHTAALGGKPGEAYISSSGVDDGAKSAGVYADGPEVLVVWSDACGLPFGSGQKLTKFRVMTHLWFSGSMAAAARDLGSAALARAAGACTGADEDVAGLVSSVWPGSVLDAALEALGGGWKSGGHAWTIRTADGSFNVTRRS